MDKGKYDIFISYRRAGGKNYARTLKPELEKRGFRVFLDFDELKDGVFDKRIMDAISEAPIFLVILSKGALDRCVNDGDWVREEILYADKTNRHIVPVEVDKTFREFPKNLPNEVKSVLGPHQFSQIDTETLLQESIDKMVRERIKPYVTNVSGDPSPLEEESTEGAEIHIEVDADCDMYRFKKLLRTLYAGKDNIVHLMPGKHKIEVVSKEYADIIDSQVISIPSIQYSDFIEISLSERIESKRQEEIKRQEEQRRLEEAKRKAEEDAKLKAEEVLKPKTKEDKRKDEEEKCRQAEKENLLGAMESIVLEPTSQNGMWGYKNIETGEIILPCIWHRLPGRFYDGLAYVRGKNGLFGFIDKTGELVIPYKWKNAESFSYGLAAVMDDNNNWGYINIKGEIIIPCKWSEVGQFVENIARVYEGGLYGYINKSGKVVIPCNWEYASDFREGLARIQDRFNLYGFINKFGEVIISCKWKRCIDFNEGLAAVMNDNDKWGYINKTGELVIPCKWDKAGYFNHGKAKVYGSKGLFSIAKWHTIDKTGNIVDTI